MTDQLALWASLADANQIDISIEWTHSEPTQDTDTFVLRMACAMLPDIIRKDTKRL